ncbi:MAG: YceI family protein [Acidobacteria bacterium]|nr:YceI family protein [Acidobacteriota bacterium]
MLGLSLTLMRKRRNSSLRLLGVVLVSCALWCGQLSASGPVEIDRERSILTVRVYRAGLFSAFGHDHEIRAPIKAGTFDETSGSVELTIDAHALRVVDPETSEKDRSEIQSTMLGPKVLDSDRYGEIRFLAKQVERRPQGKWTLRGELTLHGETRAVEVNGEGEKGHYHGSAELRQKDFGMTPVTVAGGAVKVKNEVRIEFEVYSKSTTSHLVASALPRPHRRWTRFGHSVAPRMSENSGATRQLYRREIRVRMCNEEKRILCRVFQIVS